MAEQTPQTLNHFALLRFTDAYWTRPPAERAGTRARLLERLKAGADACYLYQTFGPETSSDLLVWSAIRADDPDIPGRFFRDFAAALGGCRAQVSTVDVLWGFTRPSQYTKVRSVQEIDPFGAHREPYLVMYPFVKTAEWYLKPPEERQQMMAGHIKVGKQYPEITQLLLYSFGLQDQEFVVMYETRDLVRFLELVQQLRSTEARRYTERDWPLHTGLLQSGEADLERWL